jgi:hypothetical protein
VILLQRHQDRAQGVLEQGDRKQVTAHVFEEDHRRARPRHPQRLLESSGWIRDGAETEVECHGIKALVRKRQVLRVYLYQPHRPAALHGLLSSEPKHAHAGVDADHLD